MRKHTPKIAALASVLILGTAVGFHNERVALSDPSPKASRTPSVSELVSSIENLKSTMDDQQKQIDQDRKDIAALQGGLSQSAKENGASQLAITNEISQRNTSFQTLNSEIKHVGNCLRAHWHSYNHNNGNTSASIFPPC